MHESTAITVASYHNVEVVPPPPQPLPLDQHTTVLAASAMNTGVYLTCWCVRYMRNPWLLTLARAQSLQAGLVAKGVLAGLHHQLQPAVDVLLALLL